MTMMSTKTVSPDESLIAPMAAGCDDDEVKEDRNGGGDDMDERIDDGVDVKEDSDIEITPEFLTQPEAPSAEEWKQHQRIHEPYKSWCPICVQAKWRALPHRRKKKGSKGKER